MEKEEIIKALDSKLNPIIEKLEFIQNELNDVKELVESISIKVYEMTK